MEVEFVIFACHDFGSNFDVWKVITKIDPEGNNPDISAITNEKRPIRIH